MADVKLLQIAQSARSSICDMLEGVQRGIFRAMRIRKPSSKFIDKSEYWSKPGEQMANVAMAHTKEFTNSHYTKDFQTLIPAYYRGCLDLIFVPQKMGLDIKNQIRPLLVNQLKLVPTAVAGASKFEDHFLCLKVPDATLPWDPNQDDWSI